MALGMGMASMGAGIKVGSAFGLVSIRADNSGVRSITKALTSLNPVAAATSLALTGVKAGLTSVAVAAGLATSAAVAGTKKFAEFEYVMAGVDAKAQEVGVSYDQLSDSARQLGRETVFTAMEVAEGMEFLAMTGFNTQEIFETMPGLVDVAAASMTDLGRTADIVSNILRGFNIDTTEMARVGDVLVNTLIGSNVRLEDLGTTMSYLGPQAEAMGFSLEEMAAATGILGDAGIPASTAGTALRGALVRMAAPTAKAKDIMEKYGIQLTDSEGNMLDFISIIRELQSELSGLSTTEQTEALKEIVGLRAITSFQTLMRQLESGRLEAFTEAMYETGTAARIADEMLDNLKGDTILLQSVWDSFLMDVGEKFEPLARDFVQMITAFVGGEGDDFIDWFGMVADKLQGLLPLFERWLPIIKDWVLWSGTNLVNAFEWLITKGTELYEMFNLELFKSDVGNYGWLGAIMGLLQRFGVDNSVIQMFWDWYEWAVDMSSLSWDWITNLVTQLQNLYNVATNMYDAWGGIEGLFNLLQAYISSGAMFDDTMDWADLFWGWTVEAAEIASEYLRKLTEAFKNWAISAETQENAAEIGESIARWILEAFGAEFDDDDNVAGFGESFIDKLLGAFLNIFEAFTAIGATIAANIFEGLLNGITGGNYEAMTIAELESLIQRINEADLSVKIDLISGLFDVGNEALVQQISNFIWGSIMEALGGTEDTDEMAQELADIMTDLIMFAFDLINIPSRMIWELLTEGLEAETSSVIEEIFGENSEIIDLMVQAGQNMIEGIILGFASKALELRDVFRSVIDSAIGETESDLEINSPSGVTARKIGAPMAMGVAEGFESAMGMIQNAMNLSGDVATAGSIAAGATTNNSSSRSLIVEGPLVLAQSGDPQAISFEVEKTIERIFQDADDSDVYQ